MEPNQVILIQEQFVLWLRTVSYAYKQLLSQQEKLEYLKIKLIGYQGVNFGQVKTKQVQGNPYSHWLEKIEILENKIKTTMETIHDYENFAKKLTKEENLILEGSLNRKLSMTLLAEQMEISRTTLYTMKNGIIEKWASFHQNEQKILE